MNQLSVSDIGFIPSNDYKDTSDDDIIQKYYSTLLYMPPEIHARKAYEPSKIDVFAAGVILFIIVSRSNPFEGEAKAGNGLYDMIAANNMEAFWNHHSTRNPECTTFAS